MATIARLKRLLERDEAREAQEVDREPLLHLTIAFPIALCGYVGTTFWSKGTVPAGMDRCYDCLKVAAALRERGWKLSAL